MEIMLYTQLLNIITHNNIYSENTFFQENNMKHFMPDKRN
jgi:hypothetical protein